LSAESFSKKWEEQPKGLKGALRPHEPLRPKINHAVNRVEVQIRRLESYIDGYTRRDASLFEKIVQAYQKNDTSRVSILSNELTEIRRHKNILMQNKLALDNIAIRLRTVFEFGNYVTAASPIIGILKNVRTDVSSILPEVGNELGNIVILFGFKIVIAISKSFLRIFKSSSTFFL